MITFHLLYLLWMLCLSEYFVLKQHCCNFKRFFRTDTHLQVLQPLLQCLKCFACLLRGEGAVLSI